MKWSIDFDTFEDEMVTKAFGHDLLVSFPKNDSYGAVKDYPELVPLGRYVTTQLSGGVVRLNSKLTTEKIQTEFSKALKISTEKIEVTYTLPTH